MSQNSEAVTLLLVLIIIAVNLVVRLLSRRAGVVGLKTS
ncbi:MAG: hypothetical protein ACI9XK_000584 [Granulosicoccus sp.]|jgi:hypothetical protein